MPHSPSFSRDEAIVINDDTVVAYKRNYHIPSKAAVTTDMVRRHWTLEKALTRQLLDSRRENRWQVFEDCYSTLYRECSWLNTLSVASSTDERVSYRHFLHLIGHAQTVYEVGSGKAGLINYLAGKGYHCVATEITHERGAPFAKKQSNPEWHTSDGVNLNRFERADQYDVVISTQVIEHLHPDDLVDHFIGVRAILRPGGKYIFNTPHHLFGPRDLSSVFHKRTSECMHLKEYYYRELGEALRQADYADQKAVFLLPAPMRKWLPFVVESGFYKQYLCTMERGLIYLDQSLDIRLPTILLRALLFTTDAFMTARKPESELNSRQH